MTPSQTFELRLADAFERYLAAAPTSVDPAAMAASVVATAPAVRRPGPRQWFPTPSSRWLAVGVALLLAAVLLALAASGYLQPRRLAPLSQASPNPSPSAPAVVQLVDSSLVGRWFGSNKATSSAQPIRGLKATSGSALDVSSDGLSVDSVVDQSDASAALLASASGGDGTLHVQSVVSDPFKNCPAGTSGTYTYSLSPSGRTLTIASGTDDCALRLATLPGTWWRAGCPSETRTVDPGDGGVGGPDYQFVGCLGFLDAGTYRSVFGAFSPPKFGDLTFTVPDGWADSGHGLTTAQSYSALSASAPYPAMGIEVIDELAAASYEGVDAATGLPVDPGSALESQARPCAGDHLPGVPDTVAAQVQALAAMPGLTVSPPTSITIDGYPGAYVDLALDASNVRPCVSSAPPSSRWPAPRVEYMVGNASSIDSRVKQRLIIVALADRLIAIRIEVKTTLDFDKQVALAMPVVETMHFDPQPWPKR